MSELEKLVRYQINYMYYMLQAQEGTLGWFTKFGNHWRELIKLYPDPSFIASLVPAASSVQQTPSPSPADPQPETLSQEAQPKAVHYQVDLDKLRLALAEQLQKDIRDGTVYTELAEEIIQFWRMKGVIRETIASPMLPTGWKCAKCQYGRDFDDIGLREEERQFLRKGLCPSCEGFSLTLVFANEVR